MRRWRRWCAAFLVVVTVGLTSCGGDDGERGADATVTADRQGPLADLGLAPPDIDGVALAGRAEADGHAGEPVTGTVDYVIFRTDRPEGEAIAALVQYFADQGFRMREKSVRWHVWDGVRGDEHGATNVAIGTVGAFLATKEEITAGVEEAALDKHRDDPRALIVRVDLEGDAMR